MKIFAKIYKFNTPNANGIIYDTESLKDAVTEFNKVERFAVARGKSPKRITKDLDDVTNIIGPVVLSIEDDYVVATIDTFPNGKGHRAEQVIDSCTEKLKIMPICIFNHEESGINFEEPIHVMSIAHIVCTCDDVDCGDVEEDMFIAFLVR